MLNFRLILFATCLLISLIASPERLHSAANDTTLYVEAVDSIVVVANRYQASMKSIGYAYQIIPRRRIEMLSNHSALELVDFENPSAFVLDKKVMGYGVGTAGAGLLNMRGLGGKPNTAVLFLLNGHPDFMGIFGHPLPDVYGMDDIEQVEILSGPASTVFGNHAMGGVVNLVTGVPPVQRFKFSAEGGSFGTYKLGLNINRKFKSANFFFSFIQKRSDGHIPRSGFRSTHIQSGLSLKLNPVWDLSVSARYVPYEFDDPGRGAVDRLGIATFGKIRRGTAEIILSNKSPRLQGSVQAYTNLGRHEFYDGFRSTDFTVGVSSYQNYIINRTLALSAGADFMKYGGQAGNDYLKRPDGRPVVDADPHTLSSAGFYVQALYDPLTAVHLRAGLRYQYNSLPVTALSPMAGITVNVLPQLSLFASYQTGFRSPTLMELYLFPNANDQLENENVATTEAGIKILSSRSNSLTLSVFRNKLDNLIQAVPNLQAPGLRFQNAGRADQSGIESLLNYHLYKNTTLQLSYSYLNPDHITAFNPRQQFKYMLNSSFRHLHFSLYGKYIEDLFAGNNSTDGLPPYHVMNASISLSAGALEVYLRLLNLLDRDYLVLPGYPAPGQQGRIGINLKLL